VTGYGETAGGALVGNPAVDLVSFTGGGERGGGLGNLLQQRSRGFPWNLGSIILDDADLTMSVKGMAASYLLNSGQTCSALTRTLVPEALYHQAALLAVEFARSYIPGDPLSEKTRLRPLVSAAQRERVYHFMRQGVSFASPNSDRGCFVQPTVFGRVDAGMTPAREEIFGPVLSIIT
jgi:betaine-aldehyde dehydrogenase